ncbi:MAG TPA: hypothetical protein VFA04_08710 [Bryobacteraceae bacterium]|nr:hypothetical protein [Bryobacteraceae bacterium]
MRFGLLVWAAPLLLAAQTAHPPARVGAHEFPLMAWNDSPSDPGYLRQMYEAGLNVSGFCKPSDLDRVAAAGMSCFVTDPRVNGYDWTRLPNDSVLRANVASLVDEVRGKPALLGFFLRDEPHASLMPGLGRVAALLRKALPDAWPYVNLLSSRATPERLGVPTYSDYVRMLPDIIHQPFLSYDNYALIDGDALDSFFTNLEIVRRVGLQTKTPFWNCILAMAIDNDMEPSDATFSLQVYSTLAYGGRGIEYLEYFTPDIPNYRLAPIDQFGDKTPVWDMLRRINFQVHALAPVLLTLHSMGVYHFPEPPEGGRPLSESWLVRSVQMTQRYVRRPAGPRFLVSEFNDSRGKSYIMLVNKDLRNSFQFTIELRDPGRTLTRISPVSGQPAPLGADMNWLAPGGGVLLRID